ncbi:FliM/FliN family flagellar motor switch protein [Cypionkella sp.]|uniref:FliM/FliN family flagellar motor switch protein n=1 Tax=Cypionkella sp. TaxID=2811411 RepID=UPI0026126DA7|nr:FliM/FliN family flagellar motor switch protein [Cypionkella sp.]MDB5665804.1 flagellar switch protein FliM [Cypionkella sp.]
MADTQQDGVIRRKIAAIKALLAEGGPGADRSWRLALARAARDCLSLPLEVTSLSLHHRSLAELLELPAQQALIAVLQGPSEGMGLLIISPQVLAAMIESQTLGKVSTVQLTGRKPTRTDAAMVAPTLDAALEGLEQMLAQEADLQWAGGFRYASFLDDPRPLGLLLEDIDYRVLTAEVSLGLGARQGSVLLALPADGKAPMPARRTPGPEAQLQSGLAFAQALAEQVEDAGCVLNAVVSRVSLPLHRVMGLQVGEVILLQRAAIDRIHLEGLDGRSMIDGRLGQNRGMRAIRLTPNEAQALALPKPPVLEAIAGEPMRQTG